MSELTTINGLTSEILLLKQQTAVNIVEIGKRLNQAKEMLPHGEWGKWLEEKVEFSYRSAARFMQVADEFSNMPSMAGLTPTKIFKLLDLSQEQRETFIQQPHQLPTGETKTVQEMSTREIQQAIKGQKEAEKKAQEAEAQVKELEQKLSNQKSVVIEKTVIPPEVQTKVSRLEDENKNLREKAFNLESKLTQKEVEERGRFQNARLNKRALDQEFQFLIGKINLFLKDVSGYVFLADVLLNMDLAKASEHELALNKLDQWVRQMKNALPDKEAIEIEGVIINE